MSDIKRAAACHVNAKRSEWFSLQIPQDFCTCDHSGWLQRGRIVRENPTRHHRRLPVRRRPAAKFGGWRGMMPNVTGNGDESGAASESNQENTMRPAGLTAVCIISLVVGILGSL